MSVQAAVNVPEQGSRSAVEIAHELGPIFAGRADSTPDQDQYVADNIALLKSSGLVEAGVPRELGGGGADVDPLTRRVHHDGSVAESPRVAGDDLAADRKRFGFPLSPYPYP